jgi:hypothetical protein
MGLIQELKTTIRSPANRGRPLQTGTTEREAYTVLNIFLLHFK